MTHKTSQLIELVKLVPHGKVVTYGQLGSLLGVSARVVGWLLSSMPRTEWKLLPWWRVVAKDGTISSLKLGNKGIEQLDHLVIEGVDIINEQVVMTTHRWDIESYVHNNNMLI